MIRYFEWNYDTRQVIEYEREGDCNRCGECCKAVVRFTYSGTKPESRRDDSPNTDKSGLWAEVNIEGRPRYMVKLIEIDTAEEHRCPKLSPDGGACMMHLEKARICSEWPFHPSHVTPFPHCSYSFREVARWPIED